MNIEGLWSIEIGAAPGVLPGGVLVLTAGRLLGGGEQYYYVGDYTVSAGLLDAALDVTHYNDVPNAVFGPATGLRMRLTGIVSEPEMDLTGILVDAPDTALTVRLTRQAAL